MRFVKAFFVGIIGLFIIITLLSLLIPSRVQVVRTVAIYATTPAAAIKQIAEVVNWKNWHPIFTMDSAVIKSRSLSASGKSMSYIILHRQKESIITVLSADSATVNILLQSPDEYDITNELSALAIPGQDCVQVSWKAITQLHWYPWEKFYAIFIDKLTGPGYDLALTGLKDYLEKHPSK
jgi:uncharacterized cysteine cluster protein YcgN (CxxCxxCC family)